MKRFIPFFLIGIVSIFTFWKLSQTFYQQDEWLGIGIFLSQGLLTSVKNVPILEIIAGRNRIFGTGLAEVFYHFFLFNIPALAWFSILSHTVNAFLVYIFIKRFGGNKFQSLLASVFFVVCYSSHQSVTWFATSFTLLPSVFFLLLSLIFFLEYIRKSTGWLLLFSYLCFFISFLFKEQSIVLILLFPLLFLLETKKKKDIVKQLAVAMMPMVLFIGFVLIVRFLSLSGSEGQTGSLFVPTGGNVKEKIFFHALLYPFTALSQVFVPQYLMIKIAEIFSAVNYGFLQSHEVEKRVVEFIISDYLSTIIAFFILIVSGIIYFFQKNQRKLVLFGIAVITLSMLPYAVLERGSGYLDSRYFYVAAIGGGILFSVFIDSLFELMRKKFHFHKKLAFGITIIVVFGFFYKYILFIQRDINRQIIVGSERMEFLASLKTMYPKLPSKPIFYITGDNTSYYYVANMAVPFQQRPGYTIMTWYYQDDAIPRELLQEGFLWGMLDEGYKEVTDRGFGYFWDRSHLKKFLMEYPSVSKDQVIGLYYKSGDKKLTNITDDIRAYLEQELP